MTATGPEIVRHRPPITVDLVFTLRGSSNRVVELLNLMSAVGSLFARTSWLEMPRDAVAPSSEPVRWEMDAGEFQTAIEGPDDLGELTVNVVCAASISSRERWSRASDQSATVPHGYGASNQVSGRAAYHARR